MSNVKNAWSVSTFVEESTKVRRSLRALFEPGDPEELRYLMKGHSTSDLQPQNLLTEFIFIICALEFHLSYSGLSVVECRRVSETGERILRAANIDPSRSQLSFLYRRLYHLRAETAAKNGRIDEGAWLVESSEHLCYRPDPSQRQEQILKRAAFLLRLGHATSARDLLIASGSNELTCNELYFRARCEWLAGNKREALALCESADEVLIWFGNFLKASFTENYRPFSNAVKKISNLPAEVIFSTLWFYGPASTNARTLALRAASLRKRYGAALLKKEQVTLLIDALDAMQEGYDNSIPLISRLNKIGSIFAERQNFRDIEHDALFLAVATRHAMRYSQFSLADLLISEYKALSSKMMPLGHDALGILSDLTTKSQGVRDEVLSSGFVGRGKMGRPARVAGLIGKGMTMWASAKIRGLMAGEDARRLIYESSQQQFGEHLLNLMSDLKGGFMKVGQLIASSHEIPTNIREPAKTLFNSAEPSDPAASRLLVEQELGGPIENFFSEWQEMPFAVGSIGQVFRARTLSGFDVAVKVQHPDIEQKLRRDCSSFKWLKPVIKHFLPNADQDGLIAEVTGQILAESDYGLEAAHQKQVAAFFAGDQNVVIPEIHDSLSTKKILTSSFVRGLDFSEFLEQASEKERNHAAEVILRTICKGFFKHHLFNADPHPGNYLFLPDGKIAFIDFGCTKMFQPSIVNATYEAAKSSILGDKDKNRDAWIALGYVPNNDTFDFSAMYQTFRMQYSAAIEDKTVVFDHKFLARISAAQLSSPVGRQISPPPETAMLLRFTWGLLSVLAYLEPELNFHRLALSGFSFFEADKSAA